MNLKIGIYFEIYNLGSGEELLIIFLLPKIIYLNVIPTPALMALLVPLL